MTFFRIFSEQENYFSCFFCVYIYYVLVDNMVSYRNKFYNVQTFQHSQFHELYIQTRIGIAFQPLILATNYKHIQTTTLALQTISNAAWIWYSKPNSIPPAECLHPNEALMKIMVARASREDAKCNSVS